MGIYDHLPCLHLGVWYAENESRFSVFIHQYKYRILVVLMIVFMCSWRSYFLRMLHVTYSLQTFNGIISCTISALVLVGVIIITLETCKLLFLTRYHLPDYSLSISFTMYFHIFCYALYESIYIKYNVYYR